MPIPDYQSLMLPILRLTEDRQQYSLAQVRERIAKQLQLSDQELTQRLPSGSQTVFANRIAWAAQYLKHAGALESVRRSVYKITERGFSLLRDSPAEITVKVLRQFTEFKAFEGGGSTSAISSPAPTTEPKNTPEELLENSFELLQEALADDLLEAVRNGTPAFFEKTVVDLLVAMGYGGSVEDAGKVIGKSGDGGIDGVIKQARA